MERIARESLGEIGLGAFVCNSSDRALNCYENAHKMRKECVLAPASLAKLHRAQF